MHFAELVNSLGVTKISPTPHKKNDKKYIDTDNVNMFPHPTRLW